MNTPFARLAEDVARGLTRPFKELPPKYFYDGEGSRLFERITALPEYYPTRAERTILGERAAEIVEASGAGELVELGAGSAAKTRLLLDAMTEAGALERYVPVDISVEITRETEGRLAEEYPGLDVRGIVCDFVEHLETALGGANGRGRMVAFLGGTIGNFEPELAHRFLSRLASLMGPRDRLLLGTDLVKDPIRLEAAYNDSAGVTAEFNKNLLRVLNRELAADFDLAAFDHRAFYDPESGWVEMRLRSLADQRVRLEGIGLEVDFARGEEMRTEISRKFTPEAVEAMYQAAGLRLERWWTDSERLFALSLAAPAPARPGR